jgi:hypothetical protein
MEACNNLFTPFVGILFNEGLFSFSARTPISSVCVCVFSGPLRRWYPWCCVCLLDRRIDASSYCGEAGWLCSLPISLCCTRETLEHIHRYTHTATECWTYARTSGSMQYIHRSSSSSSLSNGAAGKSDDPCERLMLCVCVYLWLITLCVM